MSACIVLFLVHCAAVSLLCLYGGICIILVAAACVRTSWVQVVLALALFAAQLPAADQGIGAAGSAKSASN